MPKQNNSGAKTPVPTSEKNFYDSYIKGKELYYLFGLIMLVAYLVFGEFIRMKKVYLFRDIGSDSINIYFPWLTGTSDYLKHETALGWSFSQGMGQNLFPLWLGDFFSNFLTYFDKSKIPYGLVFMEILKILLAGFVFYKFLKEVKLSNYSALIFSFCYAFSGYIILGGCWTIFSVEALYAAIILYGFERWLQHGKFLWLVIGITCMAFLQPFFLFMYTILLAAYAIVRYYDVKESNTKQFMLFTFKTVGIAAVAVLISSYQLFADILQYTESPRVGGEASFFAKLQKQPLFALADPILRFTTTFRTFGSDMLGTGNNFRGWQNYLEAPLFYCGILALVSFPHFFSSLTKRQKYFYGVLTGLLCLPILFPFFRYAFWAFSGDYFRTFSLVIILFMLMYAARAISYIEQTGKLNKTTWIVTALFLLILLYSPNTQFKEGINTGLRSFSTFLILSYSSLLFGLTQKRNVRNFSKVAILILCVLELYVNSNITVNKRDVMTKQLLEAKVGYNDYTVESINYLRSIDKSFYRVNKEYSSGMAIHGSINDAKVQGFYGTPSYFSFNQKNYIKFLGDLNVIDVRDENSTRWAKGLADRPILFSLCAGKYWLSKRTDNSLTAMGMDSINTFNDVRVFKNRYALPLGLTYDKILSHTDFMKYSPNQKDFAMLRACVVDDEDIQNFASLQKFNAVDTLQPLTFDNYAAYGNELKKDNFSISIFSENYIKGSVNINKAKILFFSFPYDAGWKATVNGQEAKLYRLNCGLTGLLIQKGNNQVELSFEPRFKKLGTIVSLIAFLFLLILLFIEKKAGSESKAEISVK